MKKLKLKALELGARELLSREQLKNVFGGSDPGSDEEGLWDDGSNDPRENPCKDKQPGDDCIFTSNGKEYTGKCVSRTPLPGLHCSDLS